MRHSEQLWTLALCLSVALHATTVTAQTGDDPGTTEDPYAVDQTVMEYLDYIAKPMEEETEQWQDRWLDGQFNVLPDSMVKEGFANTIHCFKPEEGNPTDMAPSKEKTLHFNLNSMESTVAIQLVLKLTTQSSRHYTINLYEGHGHSSQALDTQTVTPSGDQKWLALTARHPGPEPWSPEPKDDYTLTLSLSEGGVEEAAEFYDSVFPRLVIYSNDNQTLNLQPPAPEDAQTVKRSAGDNQPYESYTRNHCAVRTFCTTWDDLGWPGKDKKVLQPTGDQVEWTYCYGRCNEPVGRYNQYTEHARILQSLKIFSSDEHDHMLPPAGCVPAVLSPLSVRYRPKDAPFPITMKDMYTVVKCMCA